jgi:hypothetical protein
VESAALANAGTARVVVWSNAADASLNASVPLGYSNVEVRRYNSSLLTSSGEQSFRRLETLALLGIVEQLGGTALESDLVSLRGLDGVPRNTLLSADPGRAQVSLPSVLRFEARHAILGALASAVSAVQNASVWVRIEGDVAGLASRATGEPKASRACVEGEVVSRGVRIGAEAKPGLKALKNLSPRDLSRGTSRRCSW